MQFATQPERYLGNHRLTQYFVGNLHLNYAPTSNSQTSTQTFLTTLGLEYTALKRRPQALTNRRLDGKSMQVPILVRKPTAWTCDSVSTLLQHYVTAVVPTLRLCGALCQCRSDPSLLQVPWAPHRKHLSPRISYLHWHSNYGGDILAAFCKK